MALPLLLLGGLVGAGLGWGAKEIGEGMGDAARETGQGLKFALPMAALAATAIYYGMKTKGGR